MKKAIQNIFSFLNKYNIPICLLGLYALITHTFGWQNCIIKLTIGYPCPGCGMTRAMLALCKFDFIKAFQYNPFVFALPIIFLCIAFRHINFVKKILNNRWVIMMVLVFVLLVYILRWIYVYPNEPMDYYEYNLLTLIFSIFH